MTSARVNRWTSISPKKTSPGSSKKTAIDQKVPTCTGSPRTPCINVATYHFAMAGARMAVFLKTPPCAAFTQHWDWGTRGVELSSLEFTLVGCFFEEPGLRPGRIFWTYGCSPVNSGRCHVVLPTTFCMQMWPHHKRRPQRIGYLPVNSGKCNVVFPASFCMQMWPHRKLLPATQQAAPPHIPHGPSQAVLARSLKSSRPLQANIDFLVNAHATHVQHTCNTRATHVQHDVQHENFYCKIAAKMLFFGSRRPTLTFKWKQRGFVAARREKAILPVNLQ